jgi:RimJ/RimL family protein N-acetyltransferase
MYPILETEKSLLKPLVKADFDDMFALRSNKELCTAMLARAVQKKPDIYRIEFTQGLQNGNFYTVRQKESNRFIGFIELDKYLRIKDKAIDNVGLYIMLLPEYWGSGLEIEAMQKQFILPLWGLKRLSFLRDILLQIPNSARFYKV